jgi:hypothetical protein
VLAFFLPDTHQFLCSRYAAKRFASGLFIQVNIMVFTNLSGKTSLTIIRFSIFLGTVGKCKWSEKHQLCRYFVE